MLTSAGSRLTFRSPPLFHQIECSYDDSRPDHLLYGHLTPRHVLAELAVLHGLLRPSTSATPVDPSASSPPPQLKGLKVYIIHVKETLESLAADRGGVRGRVWRELEAGKKSFAGGILRDVEFVVVNKGESLRAFPSLSASFAWRTVTDLLLLRSPPAVF